MGRFSLPDERPPGLDSPLTVKLIKYMARAQVAAFRLTNGRVGHRWRIGAGFRKPVPTLLLEHVGRKSGRRFTTPLLYLEDGPDLVVVASQGGLPKNPQWFANLLAHPDTEVHLRKERARPVRARVARASTTSFSSSASTAAILQTPASPCFRLSDVPSRWEERRTRRVWVRARGRWG